MPEPSSNGSLTAAAYERLRADVLSCRLPPGARLRINQLGAELDVSVGAVREALSRLTSEGLVISEPQRGFRVAPISAAELADLTSVRCHIEGLCLQRALAVGDVAWEARVIAAYHQLSRTPERAPEPGSPLHDDWCAAHARYHEALVAACDSPWLLKLRALLFAQSERYRRLSVPMAARDVDREHREIMEATIARDAVRATELLQRHLQLTMQVLLESDRVVDTRKSAAPPDRRGARDRLVAAAAKAMF